MNPVSNNNNNANALTNEEMPKILSPEVLDVLPVFASMLDFKSFMRLAMTSKEMYRRCMEDKRIRISVHEKSLEVISYNHQTKIGLQLKKKPSKHREKYMARLRRPPCVFTLESVCFCGSLSATKESSVKAARDELAEMAVKSVDKVEINKDFYAWKQLEEFIKEFHVKCLDIKTAVPHEMLLSFFRLELDSLVYYRPIPANILLQATSPIFHITLNFMDAIPSDDFMQILWLIQTGALNTLTLHSYAVPIDEDVSLPYTYNGRIPNERPLLFHRKKNWIDEFWVLHWHGGVTKVVSGQDILGDETLTFSKCDRQEHPPILRKEEEVFEDLKEHMTYALHCRKDNHSRLKTLLNKRIQGQPMVTCSFSLFERFTNTLSMLGMEHDEPLPKERPLYFKEREDRFWMLNENDLPVKWKWKNGFATWEPFEHFAYTCKDIVPPSLKKLLVRKILQNTQEEFQLSEVEKEMFDSWFDGFRTLPMEYDGPLPEERPLVFGNEENIRIFVNKDEFVYRCVLTTKGSVYFDECSLSNLPSILFTKKNVEDILYMTNGIDLNGKELVIKMDQEMFLSSFDEFKTIPFDYDGLLPDDRPLLILKTPKDGEVTENRLVLYDSIWINCEWKNGHATFSKADLRDYPRFVTESILLKFLKGKLELSRSFFIELERIQKYLDLFTTFPYDYTGPLPEDDIVIFIQNEAKEGSEDANDSVTMTIWLLGEGQYLYCATWGEEEPLKFEFKFHHRDKVVPPVLKTKEHLKQLLLKGEFEPFHCRTPFKPGIEWIGEKNEFLACINEFTRLPYLFDGELPEERPLVFEVRENKEWLIFREDGRAITCEFHGSDISFSGYPCRPPPVIRHLCH